MKFNTVHFVDMGIVGVTKDGQQILILRVAPRDRKAAMRGLLSIEDMSRRGLVKCIGGAIIKAQRAQRDREPISRIEEKRLAAYVKY